jgi:16S rRNA (cytosine1402-N4)-methyltransferase
VTAAPAFAHQTVLRHEVVAALAPRGGGLYADVTLGGGGHTEAILSAAEGARVVALDRDESAIAAASTRLGRYLDEGRLRVLHARFGDAGQVLPRPIDGLVADLGVSSPQLDDTNRGMSLRREASDGPLDMRMDRSGGQTARELIDALSEQELADVVFRYGEERSSRRIAAAIKRAAERGELSTTGDLRHAVWSAVGGERKYGIDPATRTFQALRIAVNDELGELDRLLASLPDLLGEGAVAAIISFHSLEDGRVKHAFRDPAWAPLWKRPVQASDEEVAENPRARSAKLRAARRVLQAAARPTTGQARYEERRARKHALDETRRRGRER